MSNQKRNWESFLLFCVLLILGLFLLIFGHHDPRQVAKMRMIGGFLLAIVGSLRWFTGFGRLVDDS